MSLPDPDGDQLANKLKELRLGIRAEMVESVEVDGDMYARIISYPDADAFLLYAGDETYYEDRIRFIPLTDFFRDAANLFFGQARGDRDLPFCPDFP